MEGKVGQSRKCQYRGKAEKETWYESGPGEGHYFGQLTPDDSRAYGGSSHYSGSQ